ncbi:MAG: hypothetical protein Q8911_10280, partial [Bacillota bacterium]|nr:hypothetical protein [Bacillota bacterium]
MSDKKKSDSGSNKGYSRFKFWSRKNQSSDNSSVQSLNSQEPSEDQGQDINLSLNPNLNQVKSQPEIKKSGGERYGLEMKKKKTLTKFPSQQEKVVRANNNSSNSLKTYSQSQERRPRTLGNKQVANQPINLPIKESLKIMRDVMIKITNATSESEKSSVEHEVEPPIIDENVLKDEPIIMPESVQETTEEVVSEPAQEIAVEEVVEEVVEEIKEVAEKVVETIEDVVENTVKKIVEEVVSDSVQEIAAPEVESEFAEKNAAEETEEQDETSMDDSYFEAVNLYRLGLAGDKEAVAKAYELLKTILQKDPDNHLAQAYLGSVTSLLGRDGNDQNERFKFAIKGLKILDRVVSFVPDNIEIRGLRAFLCGKLPEQYFHRSETAIEDFSFLVARYDEDNSLFPKEFYCQLLLELGLAYNRLDKKKEAESTCRKLLSITDDPKYEALVKQEGILVSKSKRQKLAERIYASKSNWTKAKDNEKLEEAVALYRRALDHDKLAVDQAYDIFNLLQKRNPQDPLIRAYYADCLSLLAQSSADTSVLFRHATHSIKNLDQAVNASPDNITIRFIRGYNSYRIPEAFFKRTFTAIHDFEYLISKYEQDPSIFEQEIYLQLLRDLGHSYERLELDEEAKAAWKKLSQSDNPEYSTLGSEMLNGNTETSFSKLGDNPSVAELIQEGIRLYEFAEGGNKKAGLKAQELLRRACFADPVNSLAEGY